MGPKVYNVNRKSWFSKKRDGKETAITILGIVAILVGIYIIIPVLIPLLKLVFGIILIAGGYFIINKNSNLFVFRKF